MRMYALVRNALAVSAAACLAAGHALAGHWLIGPALLAMALGWILQRRSAAGWPAPCLLIGWVLLAVAGVATGSSLPAMLLGVIAALGAWEMTTFSRAMEDDVRSENIAILEASHLRAVTLFLVLGGLSAVPGTLVHLDLPFGVTALLAFIAVASIAYTVHFFRKTGG